MYNIFCGLLETSTDLRYLLGQAFDELCAPRFQRKKRTECSNKELTQGIQAP